MKNIRANIGLQKVTKHKRALVLLVSSLFFFNCCLAQEKSTYYKRVIAIGDAGKLYKGGSTAVVKAVARHISISDSSTTVLFLGDNIYPHGLPPETDPTYDRSVNILEAQLLPFKEHASKVIMMPGNHDWEKGGLLGWEFIKRQGKWVDSLKQKNVTFLPKSGCPGPEEIHLSDSLVLVIFDSQWWLHSFDKPGENSDCACKTKDELVARFKDIAYRNREKKILIASHHPFRSYGAHGGYYTFRQHLFPLTEFKSNLYIPLPVFGSFYALYRGVFGSIEDLPNPFYKEMILEIEKAVSVAPDITFVSGHDHNLQVIKDSSYHYLVAGSGINRDRVKKGKKALFVSNGWGFTEIQYFRDGSQKILVYEIDEDENMKLSFSYDSPKVKAESLKFTHTDPAALRDSIEVSIAPEYDKVGKVHRNLFGTGYRKSWATPVKLKLFSLDKEKGGLTILQKGGGQQTASLRLKDASGKEWVLRTIQKNPEMALPYNLRKTIAKEILQDQVSAAQPYAPLTVPTLAKELGVPHADPQIVYVPESSALGIYNLDFANTVCVFEEREATSTDKTYSTPKVLEKLEEDNKNRIDQKAVLKARLLDLLIGDWDRHEDQWRWEKTEHKSKNYYSPIPRDRDQVYFISTGFLPAIISWKFILPKFQGFNATIRDVNGFMFNGRFFDRLFLTQLSRNDWDSISKVVQQQMTDEILEEAVKKLPAEIYKQTGPLILAKLKSRRNILRNEALKYYEFISKNVDIALSDKKEFIEIKNIDKRNLSVTVYAGTKKTDIIFQRTFSSKETKEIRIYGRGGKDIFTINGYKKNKIKVRMVGGEGNDSTYVHDSIRNRKNLVLYDNSRKANKVPSGKSIKLKLSEDADVNTYEPRSFKYNVLFPQAGVNINLDDGVILGAGFLFTKQGFRKEPFAARHRLIVGRALATNASFFNYTGDFTKFIGNNNLNITVNSRAPDNTSNFFGVGNETEFIKRGDQPIRYYRTRYNFITSHIRLEHKLGRAGKMYGGLMGQYYTLNSKDNQGRIIIDYTPMKDEKVFTEKYFAGIIAGIELDTRNNTIFPTKGIHWVTDVNVLQQINDKDVRVGQITSRLSVHSSFKNYPRTVLSNRIGFGMTTGNPSFFQLMYLGGSQNLRGFRNFRFAGNQMFYHNLEVRAKLFDFASFLFPGSVGIICFNDVGRVWSKGIESTKWHDGYGGGIYIIPVELLLINVVVGVSEEGVLPYFSMGLRF